MNLPIPSAPGLLGFTLYAQAAVGPTGQPPSPPFGFDLTNAVVCAARNVAAREISFLVMSNREPNAR